jgi:tripeptide aminopeptidase
MTLLERFLSYVKIDTQSDENSTSSPSSVKQLDLQRLLVKQLNELGLQKVRLDRYGTVYAELPGNVEATHPIIGLVAHVDTALEMPGADVKPRVISSYDGKSIVLNQELGIVLDVKDFPHMTEFAGQTLIVTDGTTLLGADDKAGVAIIMSLLQHLFDHPEVKHLPLRVAFTPDEEIGRGVDHFDVKGFGADIAYTLDGGDIREMNYENFNASTAFVQFIGQSIHPGYAKGRMINAQLVAMEFFSLLPSRMLPHLTDKYEGFHHLVHSKGSVEAAQAQYILRNHDEKILRQQEENFRKAADVINKKYGRTVVEVTIKPGYRNMRPLIEQYPDILKRVFDAYKAVGIPVRTSPIRGGTDGANLTYKGLPCPNLGTGGYHGHGKYEFAILEQMESMVSILLHIIK